MKGPVCGQYMFDGLQVRFPCIGCQERTGRKPPHLRR